MNESTENSTLRNTKKISVAQGRSIGIIFASLAFILWKAYPTVMNWWDRKGFEVTVEKLLSERGIATADDKPNYSIEEYGVGAFKERKLPAVIIKAEFIQIDKIAGEKTSRCLFVYSLIDKEFDSYRNISLSECDEPKDLASWKANVHFK